MTPTQSPSTQLHPLVAQLRPSEAQIPAIRARGRDVVVTAGAGTGKTRTLVARYLSLLAEALPLRAIVAITFTNKAAREMRSRVREAIRHYLTRPDLTREERGRWQQVYRQLDAARIGTIHSLCGEILRGHPAEAQVDPRFDVLEEGQGNLLRAQAVDEAMAWAADEATVVPLFALLGAYNLQRTLVSLLPRRLQVQELPAGRPADLLDRWQALLDERKRRALQALRSDPRWARAIETLRHIPPQRPEDKLATQRRAVLAAVGAVDAAGPLDQQVAALACLDEIRLNVGSRRAWPGGKEQLDEVKAALGTLRQLWREQEVLGLALNAQDQVLAEALPALYDLVTYAGRRYDALKRERNVLDFDDLEASALSLLRQNHTVRQHWQDQVAAILVDEFQDTNERQRDLVALLNGDGGKLFIVADAKQSIYRFRGADVAVFRRERERIERAGGDSFSLDTSYRAHRALIEGLNRLLRPVLGTKADPARPWAEPFAPLRHHREQPGPGFDAPHIELDLAVGTKSDGALDRAADALAKRIVELVEGGRPRALAYGDVAILCRASSSFGAYEDALERAGIPFLTVAGRGFYGRPEIRDLLNALQALADPADDLALAGLLRSPALALSDGALYHLCRERDRAGGSTSLWEIVQREGPGQILPRPEDARRATRAAEIISDLHQQAGRTPIADILKALLDRTDYRAALVMAGQRRAARNVSKFLADALSSGIVSVGEFLAYIRGLRESGAREGEARATIEGAVQIMSIHAAKGLEFPVVAIGDIGYARPGGSPLLVDPDAGILLATEDEAGTKAVSYHMSLLRERDQEEAESDRLFYVAATRAREKLILSGCANLRPDGRPVYLRGWLKTLFGAEILDLAGGKIAYDPVGDGTVPMDLSAVPVPVAVTWYEPNWTWERPAVRPASPSLPPEEIHAPLLPPVYAEERRTDQRIRDQERVPPPRVWQVVPAVDRPRAPAWVVGSLVHEALAGWRFPEPPLVSNGTPPGRPDPTFSTWAEARARSYGITDPDQLNDAARRTARLLDRFRRHALFEEMNSAERRLHEVPYSLEVAGRVESGIIDALYRQADTWTVVEFKTDRIKDEADLQEQLREQDYVQQAQRYRRAVEQLLGQRPTVFLCLLDYAGRVELRMI